MSYDSCDPNNSELFMASSSHTSGTLSRFHRSFSMGQGWSGQHDGFGVKGYIQQLDEQQPKVILRRRNNSTTEGKFLLIVVH